MKRNKGFTLIELLVVIAIIGILSAIVLASLNSARNKANDASAEASMSQMRGQAEIGYASGTGYLDQLCTTAGTTAGGLKTLADAAAAQTGNTVTCHQDTAAGTAPSGWAAEVKLKSGNYYCVDSTGSAGDVGGSSRLAGGTTDVTCSS